MPAKKKRHTQPDCPSLSRFPMKLSPVIWLAVLIALALGAGQLARAGKASETRLSRLSGDISVHASGRGNPRINLSDGREVLTSYSGPAALTRALHDNEAHPLALASADFDEDGVPDLVCGYGHSNSGMITLMRGDVNSIYPNGPEARRHDSPFLSSAHVFALPIKPDFLGAGDFNNDDHRDVMAAALEGDSLYLLPGDGKGGFRSAERIPLPGAVTAFVTGEMDRADGLDDIVIAVAGSNGPKLLVFEGSKGAFEATPEICDLPAEATDLALGQLDDRFPIDLAIAAGHELVVVHGRNWNATLNDSLPDQAPPVIITRRSLDFAIRSLAIGDFTGGGDHASSIALLSEDGVLRFLAAANLDSPRGDVVTQEAPPFEEVSAASLSFLSGRAAPRGLIATARVSSLPTDDLLLLDPLAHQLHIATSVQLQAGVASLSPREISSLDVEGEPVAVLPMRLNKHALSDLVILRKGKSAPVVALTTPAAIITVNDTADTNTRDTVLTLREAILVANGKLAVDSLTAAEQAQVSGLPATPGLDEIRFNINGGGARTIKPSTALPCITDPVTIDGYTQPDSRRNRLVEGSNAALMIELNGSDVMEHRRPASPANPCTGPGLRPAGLRILSGRSVVTGLVVNKFEGSQFLIETNGGNVIEGNFIGTDVTGNESFIERGARLGYGVSVGLEDVQADGEIATGSPDNIIGGTTAQARNVVSGNFVGVYILGRGSNKNRLQGNYIGTNAGGTEALGNLFDGVFIKGRLCNEPVEVQNNKVGGTEPGARNVISGNSPTSTSAGLTITGKGATGNCVQGNYLGTTADGASALGNASEGVLINQGAANTTIGGPCEAARNIISGNKHNGVAVGSRQPLPDLNNIIQGNYIGTDKDGMRALGNFQDGVIVSDAGNPAMIVGNVISSNGFKPRGTLRGHGVSLGGAFEEDEVPISGGSDSVVKDNWIGTDKTGLHDLGNKKNGIFVENDSVNYTIKNNVIAFNKQNGICVPDDPGDPKALGIPGFSIWISRNQIFSNTLLGIDLGTIGDTPNEPVNPVPGKANLRQNFPVLNSVKSEGGTTTVEGTFNSTPDKTFTVEFFSNQSGTSSDCRQGRRQFVSSITVYTDANGNAPIKVAFPAGMSGGFINSTATGPGGNTSEFPPCAPQLTRITVTSNLVAVGSGFKDPVQVSIFDKDSQGNTRELTFSERAKLKRGSKDVQKVVQNGRVILPDQTSISLEEAVPPGKQVQIKFRNSNGAETIVPFKK